MTILQAMEIERLTAQLNDLRDQKIIAPFISELSEAIMTILANTPYHKWPPMAGVAFEHVARKMTTAAAIYKDRLPEKE